MRKPYLAWDAFHKQRRNAKQRGIDFVFEFEEWCAWWERQLGPDWMKKRGNRRNQYVMGRYGDEGIYKIGNVKCVLVATNVCEPLSPDEMNERMRKARASIGPRKSKYD